MNTVYLISGPCGCGKSTLSKELASKIDNSFLIGGDELDDFFRGKEDIAWVDRLKITWENIISITQNALRNHLNVIIDYVVEEELPQLIEGLAAYEFELKYIVLIASEKSIRARITARGDIELIERALFLRNKLISTDINIPYLYDNSDKEIQEEVNDILNDPKFIYYNRVPRPWVMPSHIVAVSGLVENEKGEVLLIKNHRGIWSWTGGQVEVGESLMQALEREIMEESGVTVRVKDIVGIYSNTSSYQGYNGVKLVPTKVMIDFTCEYVSGELRTSNESIEVGWYTKEEAKKMVNYINLQYRMENLLDPRGKIYCYAFKLPFEFIEKREFDR